MGMDARHMSTKELLLQELEGYTVTSFEVSAKVRREQPAVDEWESHGLGDHKTITVIAKRRREPAPESNTTVVESNTTSVETSTTTTQAYLTPQINVTFSTLGGTITADELCEQIVKRLRSEGACG